MVSHNILSYFLLRFAVHTISMLFDQRRTSDDSERQSQTLCAQKRKKERQKSTHTHIHAILKFICHGLLLRFFSLSLLVALYFILFFFFYVFDVIINAECVLQQKQCTFLFFSFFLHFDINIPRVLENTTHTHTQTRICNMRARARAPTH